MEKYNPAASAASAKFRIDRIHCMTFCAFIPYSRKIAFGNHIKKIVYKIFFFTRILASHYNKFYKAELQLII